MPIYEYKCPKCGQFEAMRKISDRALTRCPTCKSKVTKLISNTSFQLKGSGWYATDYAAKGSGKSPEGKAEGKSESDASSTTETKAEKSESKAEKKDSDKSKTPAAAA